MAKIKILIIDDDALISKMYQKSLSATDDFDVITAPGGQQGLEMAKSQSPDIILCDVMMPEPDGMEVLKTIKQDPVLKNIPVVMLTNLSGKHDAELALQRGAVDYWIKKDSDPNVLINKIKKVLGNYLNYSKQ